MNAINAVAECERDLLIERAQAGSSRARAEGRPPSLTAGKRRQGAQRLREGAVASALAHELKISRQTILRGRDAMVAS